METLEEVQRAVREHVRTGKVSLSWLEHLVLSAYELGQESILDRNRTPDLPLPEGAVII